MKVILALIITGLSVSLFAATPTDDEVVSLVEQTASAVSANAPETFMKIFRAEEPYISKANPELFAYVLTESGKIEVDPRVHPTGKMARGISDSKGKRYYDAILEKAKANPDDSGWESYTLVKPDKSEISFKIYFRPVTGSNGKKYIICGLKQMEKELKNGEKQ
ncbi:MAG: hypothetical protein A2X49_12175 [Lentisphaerae bacterium GWF2_52_8]|nr:MAG: hypothetical protein A2X49_12175 [Lentisphaerae bacterium GWF2_52_8]